MIINKLIEKKFLEYIIFMIVQFSMSIFTFKQKCDIDCYCLIQNVRFSLCLISPEAHVQMTLVDLI